MDFKFCYIFVASFHILKEKKKKKVKIHRNSPKFTKKFSTSTKR